MGTNKPTTVIYSCGDYTYEVTVTYGPEARIPKDASLKLVEYAEDSEEYQLAKIKVENFKAEEAAALEADDVFSEADDEEQEDEEDPIGFSALDISILDIDGNEIEPQAEVSVSIAMKSLPDGFEAEDLERTLEVHHLVDVDGEISVERVASSIFEGGEISADENGAVIEFATNSFSTYSIRWYRTTNRTMTIHFVDEAGNELSGVKLNGNTIDGKTVDIANIMPNNSTFDMTQFTVDGKTLSNIHLNGVDGDVVGAVLRRSNSGTTYNLQYQKDRGSYNTTSLENWTTFSQNDQLYIVFSDPPTGGGGGDGGDDEIPDLAEIGRSKEVTSNHDGTYNVELSVTGSAQGKTEETDINVVLVVDHSDSMNNSNKIQDTNEAVRKLVRGLLNNNTTANPDAIELALVTFNASATPVTFNNGSQWTNNYDTFNAALNNNHSQGTNWEAALQYANGVDKGDGDPTYIIFITDGEPTQYVHMGTNIRSTDISYWAARDDARRIIRNGKILYGIFAYGNDDLFATDYIGQLINYAYDDTTARDKYRFNAKNTSGLQDALAAIMDVINMNFAYAEVEIDDGITGLTTTTFEDADPESFQYTITYKNYTSANPPTYETLTVPITVNGTGNDATISIPEITYVTYDSSKGQLKPITTTATTIKGASFATATEDAPKSVTWDLEKTDGSLYMLEEAWTYTVDFKVWPGQASYDLVAALNNGLVNWGQDYIYIEDGEQKTIAYNDYKDQITGGPDGPFALKTNTSAGVKYQEYKAVLKDDGTVDHYEPVGTPTEKPITYTGSMPLEGIEMKLVKNWDTSLSTEDYDKIESVTMYILEDNPTGAGFNKNDPTTYYMAVPLTKENNWSAMVAIAPGIFDGNTFKTNGHTYSVLEPDIDSHYEFTMEPTHPMLNGETPEDETDMVETYGQDGAPYNPMPRDGSTTSYTVTNTLKGGINIKKVVEIPEGLEQFVNEDQEFSFTINLVDASGNPVYTNDGVHDLSGTLGTRVYREDGTTDKGEIPNSGSVTLTMKKSESIRIVNVPTGTSYTVTEGDLSSTVYAFKQSDWVVRLHPSIGSEEWIVDDSETINNSQTTSSHAIKPNAENNVTFTNKYEGTGFEATKVWNDGNSRTRPKTITLQLYRKVSGSEDEPVAYGSPVTVGLDNEGNALEGTTVVDDNTWKYTWKGLPDKETVSGTVVTYKYSFKEEPTPEGYTAVMSEDGKTVTNILAKKVRFVKEDMSGNKLENAVFTLKLDGNIVITSGADGVMKSEDGTSEFMLNISATPYELTEDTAPAGYNKLTGDVQVTVSQNSVTAGRSDDSTVSYKVDPPTDNDPVYTVHITNSTGAVLPMTGGPGILYYTLGGIALVMAAALMYVFRMRRRERRLS